MSIISGFKKKFDKKKKSVKKDDLKPSVIDKKESKSAKKEPSFDIASLQKQFDEKKVGKSVSISDLQKSLDSDRSESNLSELKASTNFSPLMISRFDELIDDGGVEDGNNIMISGGTGVGKSTFCLQSIYNNALKGKKGVYISFEEDTDNLKRHMKKNFGWDFEKLEAKGLVKFVQIDPFSISRRVESELAKERGELLIKIKGVLDIIPSGFIPHIVVIDSLSALSAAFMDNIESYRLYLSSFLKKLASQKSINIVLSETEQNPDKYSRTGVEEFLVDGVIVLYNIRSQQVRQKAIEILKLRCSNHVKKLVPYVISDKGIEIFPEGKIFI